MNEDNPVVAETQGESEEEQMRVTKICKWESDLGVTIKIELYDNHDNFESLFTWPDNILWKSSWANLGEDDDSVSRSHHCCHNPWSNPIADINT